MEPELFEATLRKFVRQEPFQPFQIEMEDQKVTVVNPELLAFNGGGAGLFHGDEIVLIDCENVVNIQPLPSKASS